MISAGTLGDVLGAALRDTCPALRSWIVVFLATIVLVGGGFVELIRLNVLSGTPVTLSPEQQPILIVTSLVVIVMMLVASITCVASAVRTVKPDFRMTLGKLVRFIGWSLLCGLIIMLGFVLLVIPGLYLAVKLAPAPYLYLLGEDAPLDRSFTLTRGRFWMTVLVLLVVAAIGEAAAYATGFALGFLAFALPSLTVAIVPAIVLIEFVVFQFTYNAYVRWTDALRTAGVVGA